MSSHNENFRQHLSQQLQTVLIEVKNWNEADENALLTANCFLRTLFRAVHNVKGSAVALGQTEIHDFAHEFEDFLEILCDGKAVFNQTSRELTVNAAEHLMAKMRAETSENKPDSKVLPQLRKWTMQNSSEKNANGSLANFLPPRLKEYLTENEIEKLETRWRRGERIVFAEKSFLVTEFANEFCRLTNKIQKNGEILTTFPSKNAPLTDEKIILEIILVLHEKSALKDETWRESVDRVKFDSVSPFEIAATFDENEFQTRAVNEIVLSCAAKARRLADEFGKKIRFITITDDFHLAYSKTRALETILLHLLRNAIDHAVENEVERIAVGKDAEAEICIEISGKGNQITLKVKDDGRGIDWSNIERHARANKFLTSDEKPSAEMLKEMIFVGGFSTSKEKTKISGRGVGLEIVKNEAEKFRGTIEVFSECGAGTEFIFTFEK